MIKSTFGITQVPFFRGEKQLLKQQKEIYDTIKIHSQQGGLCIVTGQPGVGKSVLRNHIIALNKQKDHRVISFSRTMHTYNQILRQILESMEIDGIDKTMEKDIISAVYHDARERRTLITIIDEAHLIDMQSLRKLRLLFDQFPDRHNLVLIGQPELMHYLCLQNNHDIKSRITFSKEIKPLDNDDLQQYILDELEAVRLGPQTFDEGAVELILRSVQGNLRLCANLCYCSLLHACQQSDRIVQTSHVNAILIQPHWRTHDELIKAQASA